MTFEVLDPLWAAFEHAVQGAASLDKVGAAALAYASRGWWLAAVKTASAQQQFLGDAITAVAA